MQYQKMKKFKSLVNSGGTEQNKGTCEGQRNKIEAPSYKAVI